MILTLLLGCAEPPQTRAPQPCRAAAAPDFDPLARAGEPPRAVLFISLDTVRPELLGPENTPAIDALMARSLVLDDHWSCANWTFPSMVCVQAGLRPFDAGFLAIRGDGEWTQVPASVTLASEALAAAGWQTALVTSNANFGPDVLLDAGFETVDDGPSSPARWVTDQALARLEAMDPDRPWYLHAHYIDPHHPYDPPAEYLDGLSALAPLDYDLTDRDEYDRMAADWHQLSSEDQALVLAHLEVRYTGEHRYADDEIARLLDGAQGRLERAVVVFLTDHGEQFFEHERFGHAQSLYGEELRAVAAISAPGLSPARWSGPTSHQDIWPTIFALLDQPIPQGFEGYPLGTRPAGSVRAGLRIRDDQLAQFAECGSDKLIYQWSGERLLFQIDRDPDETRDVYGAGAGCPAPLWEAVLADIERAAPLAGQTPIDAGP